MFLIPALGLLLLMRSSATEKRNPPPDIPDAQALTIVSTGIFALTPDSMGITFYVHLVNHLPVNLDVATRMWECCETFEEGEVDCSHMHLMGGYKGVICPGHASNVTLFYPNLYVYNRIGECLVGVWYRDPDGKVKELRTKVNFDTTLTPRHIAPSIAAYYDSEMTRVRKCAYIDEDPLDKCRPVDCSRKYNGQRLFYSHVEHRCLPAPKCNNTKSKNITRKFDSSDQKTILPNLVYAPEANICDDLEPIIREEDVKTLNSGRGVDQDLHPSNEYDFIVCHNGNKSLFTGRCTCNEGWSSTANHIRPTTLKIHLCTVSRFGPTTSFDDAVEDMIYTIRLVTPRFIEAVTCLPFFLLPASVLGSVALLSVCLSAVFTRLYKVVSSDTPLPNNADLKKPKKPYDNFNQIRHTEVINYDHKPTIDDISTDNIISSDGHNISSPRYHDFSVSRNVSSFCQKHREYSPNVIEQPSSSIDFYTQTLPRYKTEDYCATRSLSPQERTECLGRLDEPTSNELEPLLLEETLQGSSRMLRNDRSICTNPFRSVSRVSEPSHIINLWKNNLAIQRKFEGRKRQKRDKRSARLAEASSFSKSMAQLTYSTLPSSDSLLSLEETGTTNIPTDDDH